MIDWLKLLNFEVTMISRFNLESIDTKNVKSAGNFFSLTASAYGVKAIKRRYNLIPLTPVKELVPSLAIASPFIRSLQGGEDE